MNILEITSRERQTTISVPIALPGAVVSPADADQGITVLLKGHRMPIGRDNLRHLNSLNRRNWYRLLSDLVGLKIDNATIEISDSKTEKSAEWSSEHSNLLAEAGIIKLSRLRRRACIKNPGTMTGPDGSFMEYRPADELVVESVTDLPVSLELAAFWYSERDSDHSSEIIGRRLPTNEAGDQQAVDILAHVALIKPRLMGRLIAFRPNAALLSRFTRACLTAIEKNKTASG